MAKNILTSINLNKNELQNAVIHNGINDPAVDQSVKGQIYFNTTSNELKYFNGTAWVAADDAPVENVKVDGTSVVTDKVANITLTSFGVTATKDELNVLDGITASTAELNYTDGVTSNIQTQLDAKQASLSETQMAAVNSGVNATKVSSYDSHVANGDIHVTASQKTAWTAKYDKPADGIPSTDMTSTVQASLVLADSALQKDDITEGSANGTISVDGDNVAVHGLGSAAYTETSAYDASGAAATAESNAKTYAKGLVDALDGTITGTPAADSTITALSQTDGKVTATVSKIAITSDQVSGLGTAAAKDFTTTVSSGSEDLVTSGAVYSAIDALPEPMVFKGTVGESGTIEWSELPEPSTSNQGWTYKVITDHDTAPVCEEGDTIVSNITEWVVIPSGDEGSGTVTNVTAGDGLETASGQPITSTGIIKHSVPTGAAATNSGFYKVATDKFGHVTGTTAVTKADITALEIPGEDTNTTYTLTQDSSDGHKITLTPSTGSATTITIPDNNTEYTAGTALTLTGTQFKHNTIGTAGTYGPTTDVSGTEVNIPYVTTDAQGHVSVAGTHKFTVSGLGNAKKTQTQVTFENATSATAVISDATEAWALIQVYDTSGNEVIIDVNQVFAEGTGITITLTTGRAISGTYNIVVSYK